MNRSQLLRLLLLAAVVAALVLAIVVVWFTPADSTDLIAGGVIALAVGLAVLGLL